MSPRATAPSWAGVTVVPKGKWSSERSLNCAGNLIAGNFSDV